MSKPKIFVSGHNGMVGSALIRLLKKQKVEIITRTRDQLDLLNQVNVQNFFEEQKIDQVYLAAAKVGGIYSNNKFPAEFIYENLMIQTNIIHSAYLGSVKKLLFLGSSCIYPKYADQPMAEDELLSGKLEPTNEPYAIAKIAGIKMCESYNRQYGNSHGVDYRSIMPTNLYGPGDNYNNELNHVIPALLRRFHEAKVNSSNKVTVWGSGQNKREFLYVDDLARAAIHIMNLDKEIYLKNTKLMRGHINVGSGLDITIEELSKIIKKITRFQGSIEFDNNKLEGTPRKLLNSKLLNSLGWESKISLEEGLLKTYEEFLLNYESN